MALRGVSVSVDGEPGAVGQHPVLVCRVETELDRRPRVEGDLGAEQGGEGLDRRGLAGEGAEEDREGGAVESRGGRLVVLESLGGVAMRVGQGDPELGAVQDGRAGGGDLGVGDAEAAGHQVDLAGADDGVRAEAVAVLDLAGEQPADGLQPGVRVGRDVHAAGAGDVVRAVVVGEAPGADQRALALREGAPHGHRARAAEGDVAGFEDLHAGGGRRRGADGLLRLGLDIAHPASLPDVQEDRTPRRGRFRPVVGSTRLKPLSTPQSPRSRPGAAGEGGPTGCAKRRKDRMPGQT